jgi:hypothetical protein
MKRQSAFNKALREAQKENTVKQENRETVKQLDSDTVEQSSGETVIPQEDANTVKRLNSDTVKRELTKTSFYLRPHQLEKLDDLAHDCKKATGTRIDRQDIIRVLIDSVDLESILRLLGKK